MIDALNPNLAGYHQYLPALLSVGIFTVTRTLFIILGWVSILLSGIVLKLMLATGFIFVEKRSITQEYFKIV